MYFLLPDNRVTILFKMFFPKYKFINNNVSFNPAPFYIMLYTLLTKIEGAL